MSVVNSHSLNSSYMLSSGRDGSKYSLPGKLMLFILLAIVITGLIIAVVSYRAFNVTRTKTLFSSNNAPSKINVSKNVPKPTSSVGSSSSASVNVNGQKEELSNPTNYSQTFTSNSGASVNVSISDHQSSSGNGTNQSTSSVSVNTN